MTKAKGMNDGPAAINPLLLRPIRPIPYQPTGDDLRKLLKRYGCHRRHAAAIMEVRPETFNRYCLPWASPHKDIIPRLRWRVLNEQLENQYQDKLTAGGRIQRA